MPKLILKGKWKYSRIYKAVWEAPISAKAKLVWAALDWYGDKIFPSHTTLAQMTGLSVAGVKRAIEELQKATFLSKETRDGISNSYELFPDGNQVHLELGQEDPGQKTTQTAPDPGHHEPGLRFDPGHPDPLTKSKALTSAPSKVPTSSAGAEPHGFTKRLFEKWWSDTFKITFGTNFIFTPRDAKAAKALVAQMPLEALKATVQAAWASPIPFVANRSKAGIYGFAEVVNQVTVPGAKPYDPDQLKGYARG